MVMQVAGELAHHWQAQGIWMTWFLLLLRVVRALQEGCVPTLGLQRARAVLMCTQLYHWLTGLQYNK
jgi:hypothetical protein